MVERTPEDWRRLRVQAWRMRKTYSQAALARKLGVSRMAIHRWLKARKAGQVIRAGGRPRLWTEHDAEVLAFLRRIEIPITGGSITHDQVQEGLRRIVGNSHAFGSIPHVLRQFGFWNDGRHWRISRNGPRIPKEA